MPQVRCLDADIELVRNTVSISKRQSGGFAIEAQLLTGTSFVDVVASDNERSVPTVLAATGGLAALGALRKTKNASERTVVVIGENICSGRASKMKQHNRCGDWPRQGDETSSQQNSL